MAEKVITKLSFVGEGHAGHIAYPGEIVDVDAKTGALAPAGSTPLGNLTDEQLKAELDRRKGSAKEEPVFGDNVADPTDENTGAQPLVMAPIRPGSGPTPQGLPPGTVPHGDSFIRPAPEDANAAVEVVLGTSGVEGGVRADVPLEEQTAGVDAAFDHDGDGKAGGAPKGGNKKK